MARNADTARQRNLVLEAVRANPGRRTSELAESTGLTVHHVSNYSDLYLGDDGKVWLT